jgi:2-C-methyl-D-erythritol 4-phosphate cytidylyltransferase
MKVAVIVPAAGYGKRMCTNIDKPFIKILGRELIAYCLKTFESSALVSEVVVVAEEKNILPIKYLAKKIGFSKVKSIVKGGKSRSESVLNGLKAISEDSDIVVVHDCARPMIDEDIIKKTVKAAVKNNCAIAAVRVKPTIKEACKGQVFVRRTLDRAILWEAQTPQAFKSQILRDAYKKAGRLIRLFTDDAGIVEKFGYRVCIVESSYRNIKITTPEDIIIAELLLKGCKI